MKVFLGIVFACLCLSASGRSAALDKLYEVNKCWAEQPDIPGRLMGPGDPSSETAWIDYHLLIVAQTLRGRSNSHLSCQQAANRAKCLNELDRYRRAGRFPLNEDYPRRTPIFIDKHDNFCAVGHLLKTSGYESLSRNIAAGNNLIYVRDITDPALVQWADENGFTIDELAWIQPGYSSYPTIRPFAIGKGVDGEVKELMPDNDEGRLYVGGRFTNVDSTITANNIAFLTGANGVYTWHSMGDGLNGPVHAIAKLNGKIYAGGSFTRAGNVAVNNIACWDGSTWSAAGCIHGTVYDLAVMQGQLYACGTFDECAGLADINVAKLTGTGTVWQGLPGLSGKVNTMYALDSILVLGGAFSYQNAPANVIKWTTGSWFTRFGGPSVVNEVMDLGAFKDTLYAVCKRKTYGSYFDSMPLVSHLADTSWVPEAVLPFLFSDSAAGVVSFNTLCPVENSLLVGGNFYHSPRYGYQVHNCYALKTKYGSFGTLFGVDSAVNKMVVFNGDLFSGGRFKANRYFGILNGISRVSLNSLDVPDTKSAGYFDCYPNPVAAGGTLGIRTNLSADHYQVRDLYGRVVIQGQLSNQAVRTVTMQGLTPGTYLLEVLTKEGSRLARRLVVN